jgi:hypothetical protein
MYLTPERFKTMGLGVDLSDVEDVAVRSAITRATAQINAACAVPRVPQAHDFRGGIITGERHDWVIDQYERPHPNRVYLNHWPIKSVERIDIWSDNHNRISIDVSQVVINNSGGYIEISSLLLTQYGVFGVGIVPYIGLFNPIVEVDYTYRHEFSVVDEIADPVDARTYQTQSQFWLAGAPVTVKIDGTVVSASDYAVNAKEGWIVFDTNQAADIEVTVSYTFTLPWEVSQACAIIVADDLGESDLRSKGMAGLDQIRVRSGGGAEVELRRQRQSGESGKEGSLMDDMPDAAARLLYGFSFISAR